MRRRKNNPNPFAALIGVLSLIVALLYVAGFAYRWSYYYNFGVQHLVFKLNAQTFLVTAFELIRTWDAAGLLLVWVALPVFAVNVLLGALPKALESRRAWLRWIATHGTAAGLGTPLFVDSLRAVVIVYGTYHVASTLGSEAFLNHIRIQPGHPLPAVTAVIGGDKDNPILALTCGAQPGAANLQGFIGDGQRLHDLQQFYRTCNRPGLVSWRLLYRDNEEIYLFAAEPGDAPGTHRRPLSLVLPNRGNVALLME